METQVKKNKTKLNKFQEVPSDEFKTLFLEGAKSLTNWTPVSNNIEGEIDVLDFFSGCGGMSLGFASLGRSLGTYRVIGGVDLNEVALRTFEKNYKAKTLKRDIKDIYNNNDHEEVAAYFGLDKKRPLLVIGCAPCQGFSAHQKKNGQKDDERNTLIGAFTEIIMNFSPEYIVMENVPEILGKKYQKHYEEAKRILNRKGYQITQQIYNSASFGVPQARHRAIIVASKSKFSLPKELFAPAEFVTVQQAISDLPPVKPGEILSTDILHRCAGHKQSTIDTIALVPENGGSRPFGVGPKCLDKVNGFSDVYGRLSWNKPSITITQYSRNPASGRFSHPEQNRGLTIREAARIQSFPDGFLFEGNLDQCFKQIGEAVPPLLSLAIATQIAIKYKNTHNRK